MQRAQTHLHVSQILLHYGHFLVVYSSDLGVRFLFNCLQVDLILLHLPQTTQREKDKSKMYKKSVTKCGMRKFDLNKPFTQSLSNSNMILALTNNTNNMKERKTLVVFGRRYLSCFVLIFCSSCLFLPFSSDSFFFLARSSLSRRSSLVCCSRMAAIRSSILCTCLSAACQRDVK